MPSVPPPIRRDMDVHAFNLAEFTPGPHRAVTRKYTFIICYPHSNLLPKHFHVCLQAHLRRPLALCSGASKTTPRTVVVRQCQMLAPLLLGQVILEAHMTTLMMISSRFVFAATGLSSSRHSMTTSATLVVTPSRIFSSYSLSISPSFRFLSYVYSFITRVP